MKRKFPLFSGTPTFRMIPPASLLIIISIAQGSSAVSSIIFQPSKITMKMGEIWGPINVTYFHNETDRIEKLILSSSNELINFYFDHTSAHQKNGVFQGQFNVTANFLGNYLIS
jgi:hypothetical protein